MKLDEAGVPYNPDEFVIKDELDEEVDKLFDDNDFTKEDYEESMEA